MRSLWEETATLMDILLISQVPISPQLLSPKSLYFIRTITKTHLEMESEVVQMELKEITLFKYAAARPHLEQ